MEAENEEQQTDRRTSRTQQSQETKPASKLRDLKPEKDPMGAGEKIAKDLSVDKLER